MEGGGGRKGRKGRGAIEGGFGGRVSCEKCSALIVQDMSGAWRGTGGNPRGGTSLERRV